MAKHYFFGEPISHLYQEKYEEYMNKDIIPKSDFTRNMTSPSINIDSNIKAIVEGIKDDIISSINNKEINININLNLKKDKDDNPFIDID